MVILFMCTSRFIAIYMFYKVIVSVHSDSIFSNFTRQYQIEHGEPQKHYGISLQRTNIQRILDFRLLDSNYLVVFTTTFQIRIMIVRIGIPDVQVSQAELQATHVRLSSEYIE